MDNNDGDYGTDAPYTRQDHSLLRQVRDDIMQHPEDYREGAAYLKQEFGPEGRHAYALADWKTWKDEPAQKGAWEAVADRQSADIADNAKRRRHRGKVLRELMAPPRLDDWPLSKCFCKATEALFRATGSGCDDVTAQAVLLLAVMLWDQKAETRHELFALFGTWDQRWMATDLVYEGDRLKAWMDNVNGALDILLGVGPRVRQAIAMAAANEGGTDGGVGLLPKDIILLQKLAELPRRTYMRTVELDGHGVGTHTRKDRLKALIDAGYVERRRMRGEVRITDKGREALKEALGMPATASTRRMKARQPVL